MSNIDFKSLWFISKSLKNKAAYSLIELLIVIAILAVAITSILAFLTSNIKVSNQANVNSEVKQNADSVLAALEKQIRNSDSVTLVDSKNLIFSRQEGEDLYVKCVDPNYNVPFNGYIALYIGSTAPLTSDFKAVSNKDATAGINIDETCKFSITSNPGAPQTVSISLNVKQAVKAPTREDYSANYKVQTTISLRRYN